MAIQMFDLPNPQSVQTLSADRLLFRLLSSGFVLGFLQMQGQEMGNMNVHDFVFFNKLNVQKFWAILGGNK